jgi:predicted enzyme related to lactoylglutathione lyase
MHGRAALDKIAANGGSTVEPPLDVPGGPSIALFSDPEGHVIGLVKGWRTGRRARGRLR